MKPEDTYGKWHGILPALGIAAAYLSGKHSPCPMCGGADRFRFDNKEGRGTWFCTHCGAGNGFTLLKLKFGWEFPEALQRAKEVIDTIEPKLPKFTRDVIANRRAMGALWDRAHELSTSAMVTEYLKKRGIDTVRRWADIGVVGGDMMVAKVSSPAGRGCQLHRTILAKDGTKTRMLMPGHLTPGAAIRLLEPYGKVLGVAEGIETAMSTFLLFSVPTWAAINAANLAHFVPPSGITDLIIYADNDASFTGQQAAFSLAKRLAREGKSLTIRVEIPARVGDDWNDVLRRLKEEETHNAARP